MAPAYVGAVVVTIASSHSGFTDKECKNGLIDTAGNLKIDKGKAKDKVDGIVALVMALGEYMTDIPEGPSRYENEDLIFL